MFSPHTWGCTSSRGSEYTRSVVFPTHVGVYRNEKGDSGWWYSFPHTRGGVPLFPLVVAGKAKRFPHTRGGVP